MNRYHWFSLQIRPVGANCNLNCQYCVYGKRTGEATMSEETLTVLIKKFLNYSYPDAVFCWHGGEPTLAGEHFYATAGKTIESYKYDGHNIRHALQTNATCITPRLARLFHELNFNVGVSIDGPEKIHNLMRRQKNGAGSFAKTMKGLETLRNASVPLSVIATVSKKTLPYTGEVFHFLIKKGFTSISYSPVFDSLVDDGLSITNDEWCDYLKRLFDAWWDHEDDNIQIRELNELIVWLSGKNIGCCSSSRSCSHWLSIEPNGEIFPCEKYNREFILGNIRIGSFSEIAKTLQFRRWQLETRFCAKECQNCPFRKNCGNGCPQMRAKQGKFSRHGLYGFCQQRMQLYQHIRDRFAAILPIREEV